MKIVQSLRGRQRGLSLVELMVGIAVGMFVVAAAATLVSTQLVDNRRLLLELQVQQDLRATADIITRDIRRIGATGAQDMTITDNLVWTATSPSSLDTTFHISLLQPSQITFSSPRQAATTGPFGYRLETTNTAKWISSSMPRTGDWQPLTDSDAMKVTAFLLTPVNEPPIKLACQKLCPPLPANPADLTYCWPTITVRSIQIDITGQAKTDPSIIRRVRSVARLRNDLVEFNTGTTTEACPS